MSPFLKSEYRHPGGARDFNILAAELHEATARCHREAAKCHNVHDGAEALDWATKAHAECNRAFNATIAAHMTSAGDQF